MSESVRTRRRYDNMLATGMPANEVALRLRLPPSIAHEWENSPTADVILPHEIDAKLSQARKLRSMGLSLVATACACRLPMGDVHRHCGDISPSVNIPDLPGLKATAQRVSSAPVITVAKVLQMRQQRYTLAEIAASLGLSLSTVAKYVKGAARGTPVPEGALCGAVVRHTIGDEAHRWIHDLRHGQGMTYAQIAEATGMSIPTIAKYSKVTPQ